MQPAARPPHDRRVALRWVGRLRDAHPAEAVVLHGAITGAVSDVLAQAVAAHGRGGGGGSPLRLGWSRVATTTVVSLLSDDLPFLLWVSRVAG